MSTDNSFGGAFSFSFGEITNVSEDPSQAGQVKFKEQAGSGQTDQIDQSEAPWHNMLFPSTNPSLKNIGGPHTGAKVGSRVLVLNIGKDKKDRIVLGTMLASGNSTIDGSPNFDSNMAPQAKNQSVGGQNQPTYGDLSYTGMQAQDSPGGQGQDSTQQQKSDPIWYLAQTQLGIGQQGNTALYPDQNKDVTPNVKAMTVGFGETSSA